MNVKGLMATVCGFLLFGVAHAQSSGTAAPGRPDDAQIAAIVVTANRADIDAAKVARDRTTDKDVKEFASMMIRDHEAANKQARALVGKLHVKPEPSSTSKSLAAESKQNIQALKKLRGAAFDKAYMDHEVAYHQQVLDAINSTLLPSAQNPELKALLEKVTPAFQAHLDRAKQLDDALASRPAARPQARHPR